MEIQKQERANISFISHSGKSLVNECVAEYNFLLWKLKSLLASKGEDSIEQAIRYQANPTQCISVMRLYVNVRNISKNENATIPSGCDYAKGFRLVRQRIY
jgi:hypothetical protein